MSLRAAKVMLLFEGVPDVPALEAVSGLVAHRVSSAPEAAQAMASFEPDLLVIRGDAAWQRHVVGRMSEDRRPAVLVVGGGHEAATIADEWLSGPPRADEAEMRLELARHRAKERRRLARRAFVDSLTGLPNRRAVIRTLVREAARARRSSSELALVLIDLDDFKQVNETYGHAGGDRLLRKVGAALRSLTRAGELCGRIGGDEFAMVLSASAREADAAVRRVRRALKSVGVSATASACVLGSNERLRALYRRGDGLLFAAKERRRLLPRTTGETPTAHIIAGATHAHRNEPQVFSAEWPRMLDSHQGGA